MLAQTCVFLCFLHVTPCILNKKTAFNAVFFAYVIFF